jgi:hypothetical protein
VKARRATKRKPKGPAPRRGGARRAGAAFQRALADLVTECGSDERAARRLGVNVRSIERWRAGAVVSRQTVRQVMDAAAELPLLDLEERIRGRAELSLEALRDLERDRELDGEEDDEDPADEGLPVAGVIHPDHGQNFGATPSPPPAADPAPVAVSAARWPATTAPAPTTTPERESAASALSRDGLLIGASAHPVDTFNR